MQQNSRGTHPIYYGWYVVGASATGLVFGLSTFLGISFGVFLKPISEAFSWSRAEVSLALTIATFAMITLSPFAGRLIDKYGVKRLLVPSIILFGISVCGLAAMTASIYHFYAMFLLIAVVGVLTLPASYTRVILNWFDQKRGIALGLALSGVGVGAALMPPLLQFLISTWSWRVAYLVVGGAALLICLPVIQNLFRERPEEMGLFVDGQQSEPSEINKNHAASTGLSFKSATRKKAFWILVIVFALMGVATIGTTVHLMALLTDRGVSPGRAATTLSSLGLSMIIGRIGCGFLLDRFFAPFVSGVFLFGASAGLMLLASGAEGTIALAAIILLGLGFGAEFDLMSYLISRYLGLLAYGQIYGFIYAAFCVGTGLGPLLMGYLYDSTQSYTLGLQIFAAMGMAATVLVLFLGPYRNFVLNQEETESTTAG